MNNKRWIAVGLVLFAMSIFTVGFGLNYVKQIQIRQNQARLYADLVRTIEDIHSDIKVLNASVGYDGLQDQLRQAKEKAKSASEKLRRIESEAQKMSDKNSLVLQEAIEKTDKYFIGIQTYTNLAIDTPTLNAKADSMLKEIEKFRQEANVYSSPDEGDTKEVICKLDKIATNFKQGKPKKVAIVTIPAGYTSYWNNPIYTDYHTAIRNIVARYASGRRTLATVLGHYDKNQYTAIDSRNWSEQLNFRRNLLVELNNLESQIPSVSSIYHEHHNLLYSMISNACQSMENFQNNSSNANRREISAVSNTNNRIMARLKAFYGIR